MKKIIEQAKTYYQNHRERSLVAAALLLTCLTFLWIFEKPQAPKEADEAPQEIGVSVPKGFLIVPLELANAKSISLLVSGHGIIDVFSPSSQLLAKNLKILKLSQDDPPSFGALVPEKRASELQGLFAAKNLRGALRNLNANEPTQFFGGQSGRIETYSVKE